MNYKKKLIEVALPLVTINRESARQKTMGAAPHPQNLHRWWARRPLAAARAVLWASLVDDPSAHPERFPTEEDQLAERKRLFDILERLVPWQASNDADVLAEARAEIVASCSGDLPKILDPFAGGGAIPLESLRLGLPTYCGDLNPVAVLIERAMLEIPHRFAGRPPVHPEVQSPLGSWTGSRGLAADVHAYGEWLGSEAMRRIGDFYPDLTSADGTSATPIAWIWARTVKSPDPSWPGHVPLVRSWILSKKAGRPVVWIEPMRDDETKTFRYRIREGGTPLEGTVGNGRAKCLATGTRIDLSYVDEEANDHRLGRVLLGVVGAGEQGRVYVDPSADQLAAADGVPSLEALSRQTDLPSGATRGTFAGNAQGRYYGFHDFKDYFTSRQLLALSTFSGLLDNVRQQVEIAAIEAGLAGGDPHLRDGGGGAAAYAEAVVTFLALAVDRCADYWSTICTWHAPNAQLRETFARQAIPMTWDFAEANPFSGRMASWHSMLTTVTRCIPTLAVGLEGSVAQRDAVARVNEVGTCVVVTDPPYYDNISYGDLSDFFYVWLRRNVRDIWPDECATLLTPKAEELIANRYRAGSREAALTHFKSGMRAVFSRTASYADHRYPAIVFYAFKATESHEGGQTSTGWETFLTSLIEAGYAISSTWPIRTELSNRMIASGANALASSVVLACRPREASAPLATRAEFVGALHREMGSAIRLMQAENIAPVDLAQSAIGPGMRIFSGYERVVEADGSVMTVRAALVLINEVLAEVLSGEESEFEPDSRFALTWFEQFGHSAGPFGDADTLARAKNTTVAGVEQAGIAVSKSGKVRLLERAELAEDWDPASDRRFTDWEATQHLIRALEASETEAGALLARLGLGLGDRARQLAYLLHGICDRKDWADEAGAYNMLVTAWPEIKRLASATLSPADDQLSLG